MILTKYGTDLIKGNYNETYVKKEFGESLVMFQLMAYKGWDVENIDYVGVDLIAIDTKTQKRYAIQVKLRQFGIDEGETNSNFTFDSEMKLRTFSERMSAIGTRMIPIVAFVNINRDQSINTILVNLDDLVEMRMEQADNGITQSDSKSKKGYICNTNTKLSELINDHRVTCYRYVPQFVDNSLDGPLDENLPIVDETYNEFKKEKEINEKKKKEKRIQKYIKDGTEENNIIEKNEDSLIKHQTVQKGIFGEWYYMFKELTRGNHPFLIQSIGADVLSLNSNTNELSAISVKTFSKKENDAYTFELSNEENLKLFCEKWGIAPCNRKVAFQFLIYRDKIKDGKILFDNQGVPVKEYYMMYNFEMTLDYLTSVADYNRIHCYENVGNYIIDAVSPKKNYNKIGCTINWHEENLKVLMEDENIVFELVKFETPLSYSEMKNQLKNKKISD